MLRVNEASLFNPLATFNFQAKQWLSLHADLWKYRIPISPTSCNFSLFSFCCSILSSAHASRLKDLLLTRSNSQQLQSVIVGYNQEGSEQYITGHYDWNIWPTASKTDTFNIMNVPKSFAEMKNNRFHNIRNQCNLLTAAFLMWACHWDSFEDMIQQNAGTHQSILGNSKWVCHSELCDRGHSLHSCWNRVVYVQLQEIQIKLCLWYTCSSWNRLL